MKDTYRERIKEEQKKLSPKQVFFSEGYRKLFRDLANEVAGEKLEQLLLYQSTEDGLAGWNDGKRIGINIDNLITGSFLELEQKSDSLIGILGHECGHARFTDSALRKVYVQNMLAGTWYPDAPEPENEDEEKALDEIDTCLAGKNPVVVFQDWKKPGPKPFFYLSCRSFICRQPAFFCFCEEGHFTIVR